MPKTATATGGAPLMYRIGIDPGHQGAVAVLAPDGTLEALWDVPTLTLRTSRGTTAGRRPACPGGPPSAL